MSVKKDFEKWAGRADTRYVSNEHLHLWRQIAWHAWQAASKHANKSSTQRGADICTEANCICDREHKPENNLGSPGYHNGASGEF